MQNKNLDTGLIKISPVKFMEIIFMLSFIVGIIVANIFGKEKLSQYGIVNTFFLQQFKYSDINIYELFAYIFKLRIPIFIGISLIGMTNIWLIIHSMFIAWNGFSFGFLSVAAISSLGFKAIILMLVFLFPQYLIYTPCYCVLFSAQWQFHKNSELYSTDSHKNKKYLMLGLSFLILCLVISFGILTESYLNPYIIKKILKLF